MKMIRRLEWDSVFFDKRIGRADVSSELDWQILRQEWLSDKKWDLIYIFDNSSSNPLIDGAELVDTKEIYVKQITSGSLVEGIMTYGDKVPDSGLYHLALVSGEHSRYRTDSHFRAGSFERLYRSWIENSVSGLLADDVLYIDNCGYKTGMVTIKLDGSRGIIGLIAVDPEFQRNGIGTSLLKGVEYYVGSQGGKMIEVATQKENYSACRFYEKNGFSLYSSTKIFHLWFNK